MILLNTSINLRVVGQSYLADQILFYFFIFFLRGHPVMYYQNCIIQSATFNVTHFESKITHLFYTAINTTEHG